MMTRMIRRAPTSFEHRLCDVCRRRTIHKVTRSRNGVGRVLAEIAECLDHRTWSDGRIDVRRNGEWITLQPDSE